MATEFKGKTGHVAEALARFLGSWPDPEVRVVVFRAKETGAVPVANEAAVGAAALETKEG